MRKREKIYNRRWFNVMKTFVSPTNNPSVEFKMFICKSATAEYKEHFNWMYKNCSKDNADILEKELEHLNECYEELLSKLNEKKNDRDVDIKLMYFSRNNEEIFAEYLANNKDEYCTFDSNDNKNKKYKYYNNLASWYDLAIEGVDEVVDNLYKVSTDNKSKEIFNDYFQTKTSFRNESDVCLLGEK